VIRAIPAKYSVTPVPRMACASLIPVAPGY